MKKSRIKFFLKTSVIAAVSIFAIAAAAAAAWVFVIFKNLPPPELLQNHKIAESTKIYDRTGKIVLFEVYGEERRVVVPFEEIPDLVKKATIAIEDEDFYRHSGFEIKSILRAFIKNFLEGRVVQGGSTITQQLIKKSFLSDERTISRKIKELFLAINIEKQLSKDEILALYLNQIPYGSNAYGVEAASQIFFEKSVKDLSLGEAAALASLPKAPSFYSPWGPNKDALLARRNMTIKKMGSLAFITESEEKAALEEDMAFAKPATGIKAPHFVMMVQDYLNQQYGEDFVRTGGLRVITTLDWEMQQLAEKVIREGAKRNSELYRGTNAALVAQDSNTGQILALVGSKDYFDTEAEGNFNVAAQGLRQPGSTIKPFVYVAAFKKGYTPETIVFDLETEFDTTHDPEKSYKPVNYDGKFRGPITLKSALAQSINVPSVKTLYLAGLNDALRTAKAFGLTTLTERSRYGLSLVLGGGEVKLIDLVGAYSVFSEDGIKRKQSLILEISSKDKILERLEGDGELVMEPQYIRLINDILSDAQARAPIFGSSLNIPALEDYQIAVKTGTTNDYRDAWAVGYTPSLVVGVWAGNNDNQPMTKEGASIFAAAPLWKEFMKEALRGKPAESFNNPEPIAALKPVLRGEYIVNYKSGNRIMPQIHEILFYADKDNPLGKEPVNPGADPQFDNWEKPVLEWASKNIPNYQDFNQPLPPDSTAVNLEKNFAPKKINLEILKPVSGAFIESAIDISANVISDAPLQNFEVYFNNSLIDSKKDIDSNNFKYEKNLALTQIQLQNELKISVTGENGLKYERSLILFSN